MSTKRKLRISAKSLPFLIEIDRYIRQCNIRGSLDQFSGAASDVLDGLAIHSELRDLLRRRLLTIVRYGFDDSMGRDPLRDSPRNLCGTSWSVRMTERLI